MLTDHQVAAIRAEYDAMPGVLPEGYSSALLSEVIDRGDEWVREQVALWQQDGMTHFRATIDGPYIWLECWPVRPEKEARFNPPYVAKPH